MEIRLGYACISLTLDGITTSSTYPYSRYLEEKDNQKLDKIVEKNLISLEKIIDYNIANNIKFYRISSALIPLATIKDIEFDYINKYLNIYKRIGKKIAKNNLRLDFHLDQFCVLNSVKQEVVNNTIESLKYHYKILDALNIKEKILLIHVGSNTFGKEKSLSRFIKNFNKLPNYLKDVIAIENDDKIFNIDDCLYLSDKLNIPVVLDYHHHLCNHSSLDVFNYIDKIFATWRTIRPKIHFSSPKNNTKKEIRSHNDYINPETFISFIEKVKVYNYDFDIMIEAKKKDEALFKLVRNLKYKTSYKFINDTTFIP